MNQFREGQISKEEISKKGIHFMSTFVLSHCPLDQIITLLLMVNEQVTELLFIADVWMKLAPSFSSRDGDLIEGWPTSASKCPPDIVMHSETETWSNPGQEDFMLE